MTASRHRCVVVAQQEEVRDALCRLLAEKAVEAIPIQSLATLNQTLIDTPVAGILIELTTSIGASPQEKKNIQEFLGLYPGDKFRYANGQVLIVGRSFDEFIQTCLAFAPRPLRKSTRVVKNLALYLSPDPDFKINEKTATMNVSDDGCFIFSISIWQVGDTVWLRFLDNNTIRRGTVRSIHAWGNNRFMPGIGVQLEAE